MMKTGEASAPRATSVSVRQALRDHWDKKPSVDSKQQHEVQQVFFRMEELLGLPVVCNPEWQLLLTELHGVLPVARDLVVYIAGIAKTWAQCMLALMDPEDPWTDKLVEKTGGAGKVLRIILNVDAGTTTAATSWSETQGAFVITLPKHQRLQPEHLHPVFRGQLSGCFHETILESIEYSQSRSGAADDWDDVTADTPLVFRPVGGASEQAGPSKPQPSPYLPTVATLPRPDELLLKPPYHLYMRQAAKGSIEIQCSHSPSLQLLAGYLERWCRVNHQDTRHPPGITVTLHQAAFGLGEMYDRLTLYTHDMRYIDKFHPNVPMLLTLIEKVLGYEPVYAQSHGSAEVWQFRRDTEIIPTGP